MFNIPMQRGLVYLLVFSFSLFVLSVSAEAKVLPQAQKAQSKSVVKNSGVSGIGVTPRIRADRKALTVYFSNLQNAKNVSYLLTYKASGQEEGAMGAINFTGSQASQELLFGTCSKNICRYHNNIKDARLEVSYTTKAGKKYLKKYRIKV